MKSRQEIQKTSLAQVTILLAFTGYIFIAAYFFHGEFSRKPYDLFGIFTQTSAR